MDDIGFLTEKLLESIRTGNEAQVISLVRQGANVNFIGRSGCTALGVAAQRGDPTLTQLLLGTTGFFEHEFCNNSSAALQRKFHSNHRSKVRNNLHRKHANRYPMTDDSGSTSSDGNDAFRFELNQKQKHRHAGNFLSTPSMVHKCCHLTSDSVSCADCDRCSMAYLSSPDGSGYRDTSSTTDIAECSSNNESHDLVKTVEYNPNIEDTHAKQLLTLNHRRDDVSKRVCNTVEKKAPTARGSQPLATNGQGQLKKDAKDECQKGKSLAPPPPHEKWSFLDSHDSGSSSLTSDEDGPSTVGCGSNIRTNNSKTTSSTSTLKREADVNCRDAHKRCPIHYAAEQGNDQVLILLINAGADVDAVDHDGVSALHLACSRGHTEIAESLLKSGSKVNRKMNDKSAALHITASRGFFCTAELLLNHGAKVDLCDNSDRTPLYLAASRGHLDVAELLIKYGASPNAEEIHGYTPLCEAVWDKNTDLAVMLLNNGACNIQSHCLLHYSILHRHAAMVEVLVTKAACSVNMRDEHGDTPLIMACKVGDPRIIDILLKNGANVNLPCSSRGSTPLHEAVQYIRDGDFKIFKRIFNALHDHNAKLNVESYVPGDTPLCRALTFEKVRISCYLIQNGASVKACPKQKDQKDQCEQVSKYLSIPILRNNVDLVRMVVKAGFNLSQEPWLSLRIHPSQQQQLDNLSRDFILPNRDTSLLQLPGHLSSQRPPSSILSWVYEFVHNPLSLQDLTRITIRAHLGTNIRNSLDALPLPKRLKDILLLKEIFDCDSEEYQL